MFALPEIPPHLHCYMVTEAMEVVDLDWMCHRRKPPSPEPDSFVERMARLYNNEYCKDDLMAKSKAGALLAGKVREAGKPVGIYLEIINRAITIRDDECF